MRRNQVTIRTRTWTGPSLHQGTSSDSDLQLPQQYPVRPLTQQEVDGSGGQFETGDILIDHITPSDGMGNGWTTAQLAPQAASDNVEIIYVITGDHAGEYSLVAIKTFRSFTNQLVLRRRITVGWP